MILSYISKINKNQKCMNKLLKTPINSLKFNYIEEQNNINYEEYSFNGIPCPKNIEIKDISYNSFIISWKIDNLNNLNIDKNKVIYKLEMRKENQKFSEAYKGNNSYCTINNLEYNTDYEVRICSIYNDISGLWTDIQKIKILNFDSIILKDLAKKNIFLQKMLDWSGYKKMEIIYRGTRDGGTAQIFHEKCDNQGPTISLLKTEKSVFGGYSPINWSKDSSWHKSSDCFLFTLINIHNTEPTKFPFKNSDQYSVYHHNSGGPCFGGAYDMGVNVSDFFNTNSFAKFPYSYQDIIGKGNSIFTGDLNNSNTCFKLNEIEVFKLYN